MTDSRDRLLWQLHSFIYKPAWLTCNVEMKVEFHWLQNTDGNISDLSGIRSAIKHTSSRDQ